MLGEPLLASTPRALHASALEYGWYRTARNGVRALIRGAAGPSYCPTADDLGCVISVEVTPWLGLGLGVGVGVGVGLG